MGIWTPRCRIASHIECQQRFVFANVPASTTCDSRALTRTPWQPGREQSVAASEVRGEIVSCTGQGWGERVYASLPKGPALWDFGQGVTCSTFAQRGNKGIRQGTVHIQVSPLPPVSPCFHVACEPQIFQCQQGPTSLLCLPPPPGTQEST